MLFPDVLYIIYTSRFFRSDFPRFPRISRFDSFFLFHYLSVCDVSAIAYVLRLCLPSFAALNQPQIRVVRAKSARLVSLSFV